MNEQQQFRLEWRVAERTSTRQRPKNAKYRCAYSASIEEAEAARVRLKKKFGAHVLASICQLPARCE